MSGNTCVRENGAGAERLGENTRQQGSLTSVEEREYEGWVKHLRMLYCLRSGWQESSGAKVVLSQRHPSLQSLPCSIIVETAIGMVMNFRAQKLGPSFKYFFQSFVHRMRRIFCVINGSNSKSFWELTLSLYSPYIIQSWCRGWQEIWVIANSFVSLPLLLPDLCNWIHLKTFWKLPIFYLLLSFTNLLLNCL